MEIIRDLKGIKKILDEKFERETKFTYYQLSQKHPRFKINTMKKVRSGEGEVVFGTILELCDYLGYEMVVRKKKTVKRSEK